MLIKSNLALNWMRYTHTDTKRVKISFCVFSFLMKVIDYCNRDEISKYTQSEKWCDHVPQTREVFVRNQFVVEEIWS